MEEVCKANLRGQVKGDMEAVCGRGSGRNGNEETEESDIVGGISLTPQDIMGKLDNTDDGNDIVIIMVEYEEAH